MERLVQTVEWDYTEFLLTMHCFWCHIERGSLTLKEHEAARWLTKEQLNSVDWLPADLQVINFLSTQKGGDKLSPPFLCRPQEESLEKEELNSIENKTEDQE